MEPQREVDDDVQALKREVELLKTLLHQERKKSNSSNSTRLRNVSPVRPASPAKPTPTDRFSRTSSSIIKPPQSSASADRDSEIAKGSERSPRRNIALGGTSQRGKSMRWNSSGDGDQTFNAAATAAVAARERALYLQHVPVDTKRGKWWLKDRQILSRNIPSPYDDCIAVKVRETWLWSGRTVILDKIVTFPNVQDDSSDELDVPAFEDEQNGERGVVHEEKDEQARERPPERSLPPVIAPGEQLYSDSKQLVQEFLQQPSKATGGAMMETQVDKNEPLQAASKRMELQMSMSAAQAAVQERLGEDHSERQHVDDQQSPAQQALPSSGSLVSGNNHVVETLFCPRARVEEIIKYIDGAKRSIELCIYQITCKKAHQAAELVNRPSLQIDAMHPMDTRNHSQVSYLVSSRQPLPAHENAHLTRDNKCDDCGVHLRVAVGPTRAFMQRDMSVQAYNICRRLGHIEMHPFMQACMAKLLTDAHFVSVMRLFENPGMNACPVYFEPPPAPFRQCSSENER